MNIERIQLKGQLSEAKSQFKKLDAEASGLIVLIRAFLNPYEDDITKLEVEKALVSLTRLVELSTELKRLKTKIQQLEEYFND